MSIMLQAVIFNGEGYTAGFANIASGHIGTVEEMGTLGSTLGKRTVNFIGEEAWFFVNDKYIGSKKTALTLALIM